jgi:hypothetical protein
MSNLIETASFDRETLEKIWSFVSAVEPLSDLAPAACSFQGTGTRTRTTMLQALSQIDLKYIELPAYLDTRERPQDLAGYLDPYYSLYIVRYADHDKLKAFADASQRPVINAMSSFEHPCEAIADAFWFNSRVKALEDARIVIWGPTTNVLRSWTNVATAVGSAVYPVDMLAETLPQNVDLVVTDGWPRECPGSRPSLTLKHLEQMGLPVLLPTPPFTIGEELAFDPVTYARFCGYDQKACLLSVQKAIIRYVLALAESTNL